MSTEIVETEVGQGARPADLFTNPPSLTAIESRPTIVVSSVLLAVSKTMCITNRGTEPVGVSTLTGWWSG